MTTKTHRSNTTTRRLILTHEDILNLFRDQGIEIASNEVIELCTESDGSPGVLCAHLCPKVDRVVFRFTITSAG